MKYLVVFFMFLVIGCESNTRTIVIDETTDGTNDDVPDEVIDETNDEVPDEVIDETNDEVPDEVIDFRNFFSTKISANNPLIENSLRKAKIYCENLVEGDFDDWRVPSLKEGQLLITGCPGMDPFQVECVINQYENLVEGCEGCQDSSKNFALFEDDNEFIITDRIPSSNYFIGLVDAKKASIKTSSGSFGAVRCIRGNPFATEP